MDIKQYLEYSYCKEDTIIYKLIDEVAHEPSNPNDYDRIEMYRDEYGRLWYKLYKRKIQHRTVKKEMEYKSLRKAIEKAKMLVCYLNIPLEEVLNLTPLPFKQKLIQERLQFREFVKHFSVEKLKTTYPVNDKGFLLQNHINKTSVTYDKTKTKESFSATWALNSICWAYYAMQSV